MSPWSSEISKAPRGQMVPQEQQRRGEGGIVSEIETSIDTMREAAWAYVRKLGWEATARLSLHQVTELMAAFGKQASDGMFGCDYPACGCCRDAACEDAIKQHPDFSSHAAPASPTPSERETNA